MPVQDEEVLEFTSNEVPEQGLPSIQTAPLKERAQHGIAYLIMGAVLGLYLVALIGLLMHAIDAAAFKEVALALAGPLGLATAVAGFLYGSGEATKTKA